MFEEVKIVKDFNLSKVRWRKATASQSADACVETGSVPGRVLVRDSKNPAQPHLALGSRAWSGFASGIKGGDFNI